MMRARDYAWTVVGLSAVAFSLWLLVRELRGLSLDQVVAGFSAIPLHRWLLAFCSTIVAYAALAWYDRIGLSHLGHKLPWGFISIVSFTTYALSHNIGASILSGAVVRYRAYSTKGLNAREVGLLVAFCSFTFILGELLLGGLILTFAPEIVDRWSQFPHWAARLAGLVMLGMVGLYALGSLRHFPAMTIGGFELVYPRPKILVRQLLAAPIEIIGAAGIIYFTLPVAGNPGFVAVLGVFLGSFAVALASYAPGGIGVLEFCFLKGMPDVPAADVLAALIAFRLLYLLIPLAFAVVAVFQFERGRLGEILRLHF
ncbi:MAG TPA: YbhN family protein [Roseiarcus sp.]|nr:YbhN family protein [Roseiarcus sp.]